MQYEGLKEFREQTIDNLKKNNKSLIKQLPVLMLILMGLGFGFYFSQNLTLYFVIAILFLGFFILTAIYVYNIFDNRNFIKELNSAPKNCPITLREIAFWLNQVEANLLEPLQKELNNLKQAEKNIEKQTISNKQMISEMNKITEQANIATKKLKQADEKLKEVRENLKNSANKKILN